MNNLNILFENNLKYIEAKTKTNPNFFKDQSLEQTPNYLWIGCADSRVHANEIVGLQPGDIFVHRNVANLVSITDMNCLSVVQYAVEVLKVEHIIICGHYGCGGVKAAMGNKELGLIDNWIWSIKETIIKNQEEYFKIEDLNKRFDRLCEMNVVEQVYKIATTDIVQDAWNIGQSLNIHAWIYDLKHGKIIDLNSTIDNNSYINELFRIHK